MPADNPLVQLLTEATRDRDRIAGELAGLAAKQRALKASHKAAVKRIEDLLGDLVVPRPLLDLAEAKTVEIVEEAPDGGAVIPTEARDIPESAPDIPESAPDIPESAPDIPAAYTWHSAGIERWLEEPAGLAELLMVEDLGTMGALALFLSDGNELEDLEVPADDQGDEFRKLTPEEVKALRHTLLRFVQEQGIEDEFPLTWIDPAAKTKAPRKPRAPRNPKPGPEPEPVDTSCLFAVTPARGKPTSVFIQSGSLSGAIAEAKRLKLVSGPSKLRPHFGPVPAGAAVFGAEQAAGSPQAVAP